MENVEVTGICMTYNHVTYIKDALEGFVHQKTNFRYQVIVHDDASTDGTREIIKDYAAKYPDIIVPVFQNENTYSKHLPRWEMFIKPLVKGKYVAVCEGDDYWCDENKLQKQYDVLEGDASIVCCVHNTAYLNVKTGKKKIHYPTDYKGLLPIDTIFQEGSAAFHTSSLMYRREYVSLPDGFKMDRVGDYPKAVYLTISGGVYYLPDVMSVYRTNVKHSWTSQQTDLLIAQRCAESIRMLTYADQYSHHQHHDAFSMVIRKKELLKYYYEWNVKEHLSEYTDVLKSMTVREKLKVYISAYCPYIKKLYRRMKKLMG